jgi:hypothetical protein
VDENGSACFIPRLAVFNARDLLSHGRRRFRRRWVFLYSPLTALDRIEMLDDVRDVDLVARNSGGEQGFVE